MAWAIHKATYELQSPLHIGYHKVGKVRRTRYYITARNLWGAVTEMLTRRGFHTDDVPEGDYDAVGNWIEEHFAFCYWFIEENGVPLYLHYENGELKYGPYNVADFERRYLSAHVTTALDASSTSAKDNSLHEVEFVSPYTQDGTRTLIGGMVFLDEIAKTVVGDEKKWRKWLSNLQIGGERRYGFGKLRLVTFKEEIKRDWQLDTDRPQIRIREGESLNAHAVAQGIQAKGQIESIVRRETLESHAFGSRLTNGVICWAPGSVLESASVFEISKTGIWRGISQ